MAIRDNKMLIYGKVSVVLKQQSNECWNELVQYMRAHFHSHDRSKCKKQVKTNTTVINDDGKGEFLD